MATIKRNLKNIVHNYSDAQVKVREATSNDPWGPSSTLMSEISDMTNNVMAYTEIMSMIWKRLNDKNKNWRHVYKALVLLEYIIKTGSEKVAQQCKENLFAIQSLRDFQYTEEAKDHGLNVREKAKHLVALLKDDEKLKSERQSAIKAKERLRQGGGFSSEDRPPDRSRLDAQRRSESGPSPGAAAGTAASAHEAEDLQLQLALAISREEHQQELKRREAEGQKEELKLKMALEASKKEEEDRKKNVVTSGASNELIDTAFSSGSDPWATPAPMTTSATLATGSGQLPSNGFNSGGDPWGGSAAVSSSEDPWGGGGGMATTSVIDSAFSTAPVSSGIDSWSAATSTAPTVSVAFSQPPAKPMDDFDLLGTRDGSGGGGGGGAATADPWSANAFGGASSGIVGSGSQGDLLGGGGGGFADPYSQMMMQSAQQQPPRAKSAMDFLGEHGGLVNLDSLVTKPKAPEPLFTVFGSAAGSSNPFGGGGGSVFGNPGPAGRSPSAAANPFQQQQHAAGPTLAELQQRQQQQASAGFQSNDFSGGLPPPLIQAPQQQPHYNMPAMNSYPAANNPWGAHAQPQQQQQEQQAFNPFL